MMEDKTEIKISSVSVKDAKELLEIYAPYIMDTAITFEYTVPEVEEFEKRIENISAKYPYIKAETENGEILGYAYATSFKGRRAYDWSVETTVYVKKEKKRCGVGSLLYKVLEEELKEMGILNMNACIAYPVEEKDPYLTTDSPLFHEKLGFKKCAHFHECAYKFGKWYDMIWMEKFIGNHTENAPLIKPVKQALGKLKKSL